MVAVRRHLHDGKQVKRRHWTSEQIDEALHLYASGWTPRRLSARYGVPWERLRDRLYRRRPDAWRAVARCGPPRVWTDAELDDVVSMFDAGMSRAAVCEWFGCSWPAVSGALRLHRPEAWTRVRKYERRKR